MGFVDMQEMELLEFFNHLVPADFMPHGYCYLWDPLGCFGCTWSRMA